jgi:solute carrier family 25 phosphate transporter 23/24/25/41
MDKSGSGKVTFEEWRDFLLLLPRPASMSNVWKYWTLHTPPRLATSIATQDLDVILAEKPTPHAIHSSHSSVSASTHPHNKHDEAADGVSSEDEEESDNSPIFAGSGAYLLAGGLAGAGGLHLSLTRIARS